MTRRHRTSTCFIACLVVTTHGIAQAPPAAPEPPPPLPPVEAKAGILWEADLDTAMANARADGKPVIAYFTFNACHWCHKLEADTYSDQSVIDFSRRFHWVRINRDVTPEPCTYFNVSAYPSLIVLGDNKEKIHRFSGYKLPDAFLPELREGLQRFARYRAGEEWDTPNPRPDSIMAVEGVEVESMKAPSENVPAGFAFLGDSIWIAHIGELFQIDAATHAVTKKHAINGSILDICTDGTLLYGLRGGWTAGEPIEVIDPATGQTMREIITEANKVNRHSGAKGIEWIDGRLWVLEGMRGVIHILHPESGEVERTIQTRETWITGLGYDGVHVWTGGRDRLIALNPKSGETVKSWPTNYPLRSVGVDRGSPGVVWLMEQPEFGYSTDHQWIRIWPKVMQIWRVWTTGGR